MASKKIQNQQGMHGGKVKPTKSKTAKVQRERLHTRSGANQGCSLATAGASVASGRVARAVCGVRGA